MNKKEKGREGEQDYIEETNTQPISKISFEEEKARKNERQNYRTTPLSEGSGLWQPAHSGQQLRVETRRV
jgi:hypothetical protein